MSGNKRLIATVFTCYVVATSGCGQSLDVEPSPGNGGAVPVVESSPFVLDTSIHDLMVHVIDPAANIVGRGVSTDVGAEDVEDAEAQADEQWQALRNQAVVLMEAGNLLAMTGRPVVHAGEKLQYEGMYGNLTSAEMQQLIDDNPEQFIAFSQELYHATATVLEAIDNRDNDAVFEVGESVFAACESCHATFWFPNQQKN